MGDKGVHANLLNRKFFKFEERQAGSIMKQERIPEYELARRIAVVNRANAAKSKAASLREFAALPRPLKPPGR